MYCIHFLKLQHRNEDGGLGGNFYQTSKYWEAQNHRMPYIYRSFSAKEPWNWWLFCGKWPATSGILWFFATLHPRLHKMSTSQTDSESVPCCNALQDTATYCNTPQHTATCRHWSTLKHTETHWNTLQHAVTHWHTSKHTATRCNTRRKSSRGCMRCTRRNLTLKTPQSATPCNTL